MSDHADQSMDDCGEAGVWKPVLLTYHLSADLTVLLNVGMIDRRDELHFRKLEGIVGWEFNIDSEDTALIWTVIGTFDAQLPVIGRLNFPYLVVTMLGTDVLSLLLSTIELLLKSAHWVNTINL